MSEEQAQYWFEQESQLEDWKIDKMIREYQHNLDELERFKEIAEKQITEIEHQFETQKGRIERANDRILLTLKAVVLNSPDKEESKTQFKRKFLAGNVVIKKPKQTIKYDKKRIDADTLKTQFPEYVEEKVDYTLKWGDLKGKLELVNGKIINTETGEDLSEYFVVEEKEDEVVIK